MSSELIRVSILWHEMWHEALEEASRLYFGEQNVEGMLGVLLPLHEKIEQEQAVTLKEISFVQARPDLTLALTLHPDPIPTRILTVTSAFARNTLQGPFHDSRPLLDVSALAPLRAIPAAAG